VTLSEAVHLVSDPLAAVAGHPGIRSNRSPAETCARMKGLGYTVSKHINMYGEHLELVSDPVPQGDCTVVQVISGNDPTVRTLRLPVSIVLGMTDRAGHTTRFGKKVA
jgi:hypothetical protein